MKGVFNEFLNVPQFWIYGPIDENTGKAWSRFFQQQIANNSPKILVGINSLGGDTKVMLQMRQELWNFQKQGVAYVLGETEVVSSAFFLFCEFVPELRMCRSEATFFPHKLSNHVGKVEIIVRSSGIFVSVKADGSSNVPIEEYIGLGGNWQQQQEIILENETYLIERVLSRTGMKVFVEDAFDAQQALDLGIVSRII